MSDIGQWLEEHGLGKYVETFVENEVDFDVREQITLDELTALGIPLGARKRILNAVEEFSAATKVPLHDGREPPPTVSGEAQRRQRSVMFCDLVGSTALSEAMDVENYRELLSRYQSAATGAIEAYAGYVVRYMGDGLLVDSQRCDTLRKIVDDLVGFSSISYDCLASRFAAVRLPG
jgi:class 3 adenylate cyclase